VGSALVGRKDCGVCPSGWGGLDFGIWIFFSFWELIAFFGWCVPVEILSCGDVWCMVGLRKDRVDRFMAYMVTLLFYFSFCTIY
jgi:hypothetical protein